MGKQSLKTFQKPSKRNVPKKKKMKLYAGAAILVLAGGTGTFLSLTQGSNKAEALSLSKGQLLAQSTHDGGKYSGQSAFVKTASNAETLAATKKLSQKGTIKGGALTLYTKADSVQQVQSNYDASVTAKANSFTSKAGQAQAQALENQKSSLGIDTLTYWAISANQIAQLQKGDNFSAYVTQLKAAANWDSWSPEMQELFESGNAPLNATIKVTPPKGQTETSASSAVENLQQIYSGEMAKYIPLAERGKIFNAQGQAKFSNVTYVDTSGDSAIFQKADQLQKSGDTTALLTELLKAKTLDDSMRASFEDYLSQGKAQPKQGAIASVSQDLSDFLFGMTVHATTIGNMTAGNGWVETVTGFQATDTSNNYFINDANGGGFIQAPDGKYYPSFCIDVSDGGSNTSSTFELNPVNDVSGNLTSGANAGNIASLLPTDNQTRDDLLNLIFAACQQAGFPVNGTDTSTATNLLPNLGVVEQALNAVHVNSSNGSFSGFTDAQITSQSTWAGTWIGDNWAAIQAMIAKDEAASKGTAGVSGNYSGTMTGLTSVDTGIKAPAASQVSSSGGSLTQTSTNGAAQLYVGSNGDLWVKALKSFNGSLSFTPIVTLGTSGSISTVPPFYFADLANNTAGGGLQTRLAPVGFIPTGTPTNGQITVSLKMSALGENQGVKAGTGLSGLSQAGAVLELENVTIGKRLTPADSVDASNPITALTGTLATGSDGNLQVTTGSDGKYGLKNLPITDSSGNYLTYQWVEVKAPNGEAVATPNAAGSFTFSASDTTDATTGNLQTTDTSIKDSVLVETGVAKVDTDSSYHGTNGKPDLSGGEMTLFQKTSDSGTTTINGNSVQGTYVPLSQNQGLDPTTGVSAAVSLSNGAAYAPDANGNIVLLTNSNGVAGTVSNLNLPNTSDLYWFETKAPKGFAENPSPIHENFSTSNRIDPDNNNLEDSNANQGTISDRPLLELSLDKTSTNAVFNNMLSKATYEAVDANGNPIKASEGLDPKTGQSAAITVVSGTAVSNSDGNLEIQATSSGAIDVKNIDGTQVSGKPHWVEIAPADGHALNNQAANETISPSTYSSDGSNFEASATTTDKPMGELELTKIDADTQSSTTQGAATLQGAELGLYEQTSTSGSTVIGGVTYSGTLIPVPQSQGVNPKTGAAANVVLRDGGTYAADANGNVVLVSDSQGHFGGIQNLDLSSSVTYFGIELKAPYGYTRNTAAQPLNFSASSKVDTSTNNYEDSNELKGTLSDRVVDFDFMFNKIASDNGATGLNGSGWTLSPKSRTTTAANGKNTVGQFNNGSKTNLIPRDTYIDPNTGLATPVTNVNQLFLGATQTSHNFTDPQGATESGMVEYDHVQVGDYLLDETTVPSGETKAHEMEVQILPEPSTTGAPDSYELKVTDAVTHNVLTDETIPVSYDPTTSGLQLLNDNNLLGKFMLGQIKDSPVTPATLTTSADDAATGKQTLGIGEVTVNDTVSATGVSTATTLTGVLVDSSGNPVKDSSGNVIQKSEPVKSDSNGNLNTTLTLPAFDDESSPNASYTVEETLTDASGAILVQDKNYKNNPTETVTVGKAPTFSTQLSDTTIKFGLNTLNDTISGSGFEPNQQVQVNVEAMADEAANAEVKATGTVTLTADNNGNISGTVPVSVWITDPTLVGAKLTALESAYLVIDGKISTAPVAKADNWTDSKETGTVGVLPNGATQVSSNTVQIGTNTIQDAYKSTNGGYVPGTQVLIKAGEWDETKNRAISATGQAVLTADSSGNLSGNIPVTFTLDNSEIGDKLVSTEDAYIEVDGKPMPTPIVTNDSHTDTNETVTLPSIQPHKEDNLIAGLTSSGKPTLTSILQNLQELKDDSKNVSDFALTNEKWDNTTDETSSTYLAEIAATAKNPAFDAIANNQSFNNNNRNVLLGQTYDFPLMLDTRNLSDSAQETEIQMTDNLPTKYLNLLTSQITMRDSQGKVLDPSLYTVTVGKEVNGISPVTIALNATNEITNAAGKTVKIVDTTKTPLGLRYFIDLPVIVKDSTPAGTKIVNSANETLIDENGNQISQKTETRQNQVVTPLGSTQVEKKILNSSSNETYTDDYYASNLTVGQSYTVKVPSLWDKSINKEVPASGEFTFTATASKMMVKVPVTVDTTALGGHDLVTYEDLYLNETTSKTPILVAQNHEKNAASETVHVNLPTNTPSVPKNILHITINSLPHTGDASSWIPTGIGAALLGLVGYLKRKAIVKAFQAVKAKFKKSAK